VADLLRRGQGTLHGVQWRDGVLCREPAACAPPVPAVPGTLWDGRWLVQAAPEGTAIGALGQASAGLEKRARQGLPARVLAGLPALWRDSAVLGIPALGLGVASKTIFAPSSGPLA
jgi:tRNA(Ile)-lysidine synthase